MKTRAQHFAIVFVFLLLTAILMPAQQNQSLAAESPAIRIAIVVGPSTHPPGTHEVAAGGRLLAHCLNHQTSTNPVRTEVFYSWPGKSTLGDVATIVFIGDFLPPEVAVSGLLCPTSIAAGRLTT